MSTPVHLAPRSVPAPRVVNLAQWRHLVFERLRQQIVAGTHVETFFPADAFTGDVLRKLHGHGSVSHRAQPAGP